MPGDSTAKQRALGTSPGTRCGKVVGTYTIVHLQHSDEEIKLHGLPEDVGLEYFRNLSQGLGPLYLTKRMGKFSALRNIKHRLK